MEVVGDDVVDKTEVALVSHTAIGTVVATAGSDACGVGAVGLVESVTRMGIGKDGTLGGVVGTDVELAADGVEG